MINKLKAILSRGEFSYVAEKDGALYTSKDKGIKPLMLLLSEDEVLNNAVVADKIIGKAAALLFAYGGIKEAYAEILSLPAKEVFEAFHIPYSYGKLVENIRNRDNTDICPMEKRALHISSPEEAYDIFAELFMN